MSTGRPELLLKPMHGSEELYELLESRIKVTSVFT
jgi:hypothetical protein